MTIVNSDLKFFAAETVTLDDSNGGRMSSREYLSGAVADVWPHALSAERVAGSTVYRKIFAKNSSITGDQLIAAKLWGDIPTPAGDYIIAFPGTQTDTQATFKNYSGKIYGCAPITSDITHGGSTFDVTLPDPAVAGIFTNGDSIRLTTKDDPEAATGNEEILTINGDPALSGSTLTITVAETITYDYATADGARCMSIYTVGDIGASAETPVVTSTAGSFTGSAYVDNIATTEDVFTLTFTDATHFTGVATYAGAVGSGDTSTDFSPQNSDFSRPFLTLLATDWAGTFEAGDTVVVTTHPSAAPMILKRVIPPATPSMAGNKNVTVFAGEGAT